MRENPKKKNKEEGVLFNQITSLQYTMQRALHSVRMVPLPKWPVTFKVKSPYATDTTSVLKLLSENDASAQAAHMPKLLHWDLACWSLQKQRKSCRRSGSWQAVLPALETPQQQMTSTCNHSTTLRQAEKSMYTVYKCDHACKLQKCFTRALDNLQAFQICVSQDCS